ncbi:unnamed protein product [Phaedon cochleariae]|uniref:Major facilitator superfamily (MFS) profile domain-containing protein n=1 Tax=Phaedon cochleariae TaxID=80249 RepID=A0A9N9X2W5_PHACE|nr:unnamed protein product [Phaedon cochleariae]
MIKKYSTTEEDKYHTQIIAICVSSLSAVTYGILFAWTSPFIVKIIEDKENYDITESQAAYFTVIPPLMMILTCPIFSKLSDVIGRKRTLLIMPVPYVLALLFTIVSNKLGVLYLSRFCVGIGDGCLYSTLPVYIGEISVPKIRGTCGNLVSVFMLLGVFVVNVIGSYLDVKNSGYICMVLPIVYFVLMMFMPESPYYYIAKGKPEKAKKSLRWLRSREDVDEIYLKLSSDLEHQLAEAGTWKDLFCIRNNRRALVASLFLRIAQQFSGTATITVYTKLVFEKSGANVSSEIPSMAASGLGFVFIFVAGFCIERFGRKKMFMISLSSCSIVLLTMAVYFYLDDKVPSVDVTPAKWIPIAGTILFIVSTSFGTFNIPTLMSGELFSSSIKAKAMSVLTLTFGVFMFLANNIFHFLDVWVGFYAPFLFFGVFSIISVFLTIFLIPETKGKTLEDIQQKLYRKKTKTVEVVEDGKTRY